jgi:hypothetical protein
MRAQGDHISAVEAGDAGLGASFLEQQYETPDGVGRADDPAPVLKCDVNQTFSDFHFGRMFRKHAFTHKTHSPRRKAEQFRSKPFPLRNSKALTCDRPFFRRAVVA